MRDSIHVLHVDDEPDFADLAAQFLKRHDDRFDVETATSASEAIDRLSENEHDCVVSDFDMPGQDGIEFLQDVREDYPDLPFILYTGKGSEEVASDAISAGVTDYLQKESGTDQYTVLANRIMNAVESYRSQQRLAERNRDLQRYKHMINSMYEAACVYDEDGRFTIVNEFLANWYNTTREALEGEESNLIPLIREQIEDGDPYQALLDGQREQLTGEIEAEFPSRGYAVLEYRLTPLTVDETVEGIVGVTRDITKRKKHEQALQRERDHLDEFAGTVSHDIQNPLNVAEGRLELAQEECDSDHFDAIETALHRIARITEDVLWLAREGRDIGSVDEVVLQDVIDAAWNIVADCEESAELNYADDVLSTARIEADEDRLHQLLENLFTNAIEHGREDVTVTVGAVANGFYVEDDGPGIPEDRRNDVFTADYSTDEEGTGFGLNVVKQIAEAHDWEARVTESSEGGARFEISGIEMVAE